MEISNTPKNTQFEWMTVDGLSTYLNLSKSTIYKKVFNRLVPHYKREGSLFFRKSEIDSWIEEGKVETKQEILNHLPNIFKN